MFAAVLYCLHKQTNCSLLYCTVLYCTVLCCTVLYCTVLSTQSDNIQTRILYKYNSFQKFWLYRGKQLDLIKIQMLELRTSITKKQWKRTLFSKIVANSWKVWEVFNSKKISLILKKSASHFNTEITIKNRYFIKDKSQFWQTEIGHMLNYLKLWIFAWNYSSFQIC